LKNRVAAYLEKSRRPWDGPNGTQFRQWISSGQHLKYIKDKRGKMRTAEEIEKITDPSHVSDGEDESESTKAETAKKDRDRNYWQESDDDDDGDSPFNFEFLEEEMQILGIDSIDSWSDKVLDKIGL
jgi:hypothetical protein